MKLMVIGGGGREHAIIKKLKENPAVEKIYCLPGNGGIAADAVCVPEIGAKDIPAQVEFAKAHRIDYAVVAPDDPLALGAVDALTEAGVPCFGPDKKAAVIEASKAFSKDLMKKYGIPTAKYELFTEVEAACAYIEAQGAPIVVKADGLALGKGVIVAQTVGEAKAAVRSMIEDKAFGQSGARVVIEEFMEGPEVSVLSFTDGETVVPMVSSMDHKCVLDGDKGPNGKELFYAKDGGYTYDFTYDDEVICGNTRPDVEGVIGSSLNWKGFSVSLNFRYQMGADVFNEALYNKVENISRNDLNKNQDKRALYERWQEVGDIVHFKDIASAETTPMSSRFVQEENVLTLESLYLGYEFYNGWIEKLGLSSLKLQFSMRDVFRASTIRSERGIAYPFARSMEAGLSFNF